VVKLKATQREAARQLAGKRLDKVMNPPTKSGRKDVTQKTGL